MKLFFILTFVFCSLPVFAKKTICSITINSSEEINIFKKQLKNSPDTQFVELVPQYGNHQPDWFSKACQKGVQCDVLVVSGHYGGTFFGKSGYRLQTDTLEELSCSNTCDGILKKPKEVYLFGCNTLSGKGADSRTPEQYLQILLDDGLGREMSERITALRYTPFGDSNKSRMERVFTNVKNIYGFYSIAPTGINISDILENYFFKIGDYSKILDDFNESNSSIGPVTWIDKSLRLNSSVTNGLNGAKWQSQVCKLFSPNPSRLEKLKIINVLLNSEDRLSHMINIEKIFNEIGIITYNDAELAVLNSIKNNSAAKKELLTAIKYVDFSFDLTNRLIELGLKLNWINVSQIGVEVKNGLRAMLIKDNFTMSDKNLICSSNTYFNNLGLENISLSNLYQNSIYVSALSCLGVKNPEVLVELSKAILTADRHAAFEMVIILGRRQFYNETIKNNLMLALRRPEIAASVTYPIGNFIQLNDEVRINELLEHMESPNIGAEIIYLFAKLKPKDISIQLKIVHALTIENLGNSASYALRECKPKNAIVKQAIKKLAREGNQFASKLVSNLKI